MQTVWTQRICSPAADTKSSSPQGTLTRKLAWFVGPSGAWLPQRRTALGTKSPSRCAKWLPSERSGARFKTILSIGFACRLRNLGVRSSNLFGRAT